MTHSAQYQTAPACAARTAPRSRTAFDIAYRRMLRREGLRTAARATLVTLACIATCAGSLLYLMLSTAR